MASRKLSKFVINLSYAFRWRKPRLLLRLAKAFVDVYVLGRRPLRYVDFALDFKCNLVCEHCFATALMKSAWTPRLTLEDYQRIASECMALGSVEFSFQGGVPMILDNLHEIIACFSPDRNLIAVTTNGTLLSQEKLNYLKGAGVDILTVSLDSGIPEEHDRFRGAAGTYEKTLAGIKLALRNGFLVTIGTCVSHKNVKSEGIRLLVEMAKEMKTVLVFALAVPIGRWQDNKEILLTEEDLDYLRQLTEESPFIRTDFEANYRHFGCGAAKEILYLTPYGDVLACPFIHKSLGNARQESVRVIRERALKNKYFKDYWPRCLAACDKEFMETYVKAAGNMHMSDNICE
jgi:MoaA/NifB/PqqE/SkfB family radical SAM enzyme